MGGPAVSYRLADDEDRRAIAYQWVDAYRTAHAAGMIAMDDWCDVMSPQVDKVLARPGVETIVCFHEDSPRFCDLYGWICVEKSYEMPKAGTNAELVPGDRPLVHFVYVKKPYRQRGLAKALFTKAGVDPRECFFYSCKTGWAQRLARKIPRARWAPLIVRHPKRDQNPGDNDVCTSGAERETAASA